MDFQFKLGGLMGASPYSNGSIIDAAASQMFQRPQQLRYNKDHPSQLLQLLNNNPSALAHFQQTQSQGRFNTSFVPYVQQQPTTPVIKFKIPDPVVQDIICRFILNVPEEEKLDPVRVLFQIELAHWFFVDYYCDSDEHPKLASIANIPFNQFAYIIFQKTPQLSKYFNECDNFLAEFRAYRSRIPTFGAILMNNELTKVLLVQGFRNQWGFPKGKINEVENPDECAIREVFEETGYNMRPLMNPNHFIESKAQDRNDRLYIVQGVDMKYPFNPQTNYEIKSISWFNIDELPEHKKDPNPNIQKHGHPINNFYTVYPYIKRLKLWISDKLEGKNKIQSFRSKWFNTDKDEEESNTIQYHDFGATPGVPGNYEGLTNLSQRSFNFGRSMTPGEEILRSVQGGGLSAFKKTESTKKQEGQGKLINETAQGYTKGSKSKKRLFIDPVPSAGAAARNANNTSSPKAGPSKDLGTISKLLMVPQKKTSLADSFNFSAPSWENFELDKDRIEKALLGELVNL